MLPKFSVLTPYPFHGACDICYLRRECPKANGQASEFRSFEIGGLPKRTVRPAGQQSVSYARAVSSSSPGANPISRSASFASIVHPSLPQRHTQLMEKSLRQRRHGVKSNKFLPAHRARRDFNHAARLIDSNDQRIRFAIIPISSCARQRIVPRMGNVLFVQTVLESMGMDAN